MNSSSRRWAHFRFTVIGRLLAGPPDPGDLVRELTELAQKVWQHPITGRPVHFAASTLERWYYQAKNTPSDPVGKLERKIRSDSGKTLAVREAHRVALADLYRAHPRWSYQLHCDNLRALSAKRLDLQPAPSYGSVKRHMQRVGLVKKKRVRHAERDGVKRADQHFAEREVRSFEVAHVGGLWHTDFHSGRRPIIDERGAVVTPIALAYLDDRSRLICHVQWYVQERTCDLVHGLTQAIMKRGLPRAVLTDNGAAMAGVEWKEGLTRLGITHKTTLPYSPHQKESASYYTSNVVR